MSKRSPGHRTVTVDVDAPQEEKNSSHVGVPWFIPAGLGGMAVVAAGLILLLGATTLGWLTSAETDFSAAWQLAADMLLLTHGAQISIAGQLVTIPPLGLSLVLILLGQPVAAFAARQAAAAEGDPDDTGALWVDPEPLMWRVVGTFVGSWVVGIAILDFVVHDGETLFASALGGATMAVVSGLWGVSKELHYDPRHAWPVWLRAAPGALALAVVTCLAGGATMLTLALWAHRDRVAFIHDGLEPALMGTILLVVMQLIYLPNLVIWASAWVLGGGVTLGDGSLISIAITDAGFVPSVPVLGAIPEPGPGDPIWFWWLVVGVLAGAAAAFAVAWARPQARVDETTLVGGLSGVLAGALVALLGSIASGGLGEQRLHHLGVRVTDLLVVAPSLLGISGIVVGAGIGGVRALIAWWSDRDAATTGQAEEPTTVEEAEPVGNTSPEEQS